MENAPNQWIGLGSVLFLAAMVISPFVLTWVYCDRPEPFVKRWARASIASLVVLAVSAAAMMLLIAPFFPEGEVLAKVKDTGTQGLIVSLLAPFFGTDFLMRIKLGIKWRRSQGRPEV